MVSDQPSAHPVKSHITRRFIVVDSPGVVPENPIGWQAMSQDLMKCLQDHMARTNRGVHCVLWFAQPSAGRRDERLDADVTVLDNVFNVPVWSHVVRKNRRI
eukprot:TRINITY_DN11646_c0_g1_i1.p2 TRINITY_DN11646_c0_g1~~TRINITY_DN11646_c0_g1_i1.p2  ORF type:complete len:102 (-),score=17.64 TRINITY_DN11646_c0_g1_i1:509-814(-)